MFNLPDELRSKVASLRVECLPHAHDHEGPVRLLLVGEGGRTLATLKFTPNRARDAGPTLSRLLTHLLPQSEADRVADGLLKAAIKVWSARN